MQISGRRVLIRADLNTPLRDGAISDDSRIRRFVPGLSSLLERGARAIIMSHLGRPGGKEQPELSLRPVAERLTKILRRPVPFVGPAGGPDAVRAAMSLRDGEAILCENLRFDPREEANDPGFAADMAAMGEIYVNDAFACSHRAHASLEAIAQILPCAAGALLIEEISALQSALEQPQRPAMAIIGGAKVSGKIEVLRNLANKLDSIIIGGGMANTFLLADKVPVGASLCEPDMTDMAIEIRDLAAASGCKILTPLDIVHGAGFSPDAKAITAELNDCPQSAMILDVGAASLEAFGRQMENSRTILWNGPLGAFELPAFAHGTIALARKAGQLTKNGQLTSIAGGGDTLAALNLAGVTEDFSYVSTAGGAFLEWIEGRELPGVKPLLPDK